MCNVSLFWKTRKIMMMMVMIIRVSHIFCRCLQQMTVECCWWSVTGVFISERASGWRGGIYHSAWQPYSEYPFPQYYWWTDKWLVSLWYKHVAYLSWCYLYVMCSGISTCHWKDLNYYVDRQKVLKYMHANLCWVQQRRLVYSCSMVYFEAFLTIPCCQRINMMLRNLV